MPAHESPPKQDRNSGEDRGRDADTPDEIPARGWWDVTKRVKEQLDSDHIQIVAAGIAFYFFLAIFPLVATAVSIYGLVTTPAEGERQITALTGILPGSTHEAVGEIVRSLTSQSGGQLGWGVFLGILVGIWSASKGTRALIKGLNIAYDEEETRGFVRLYLITLGMTLAAMAAGVLTLALVAGVPALSGMMSLTGGVETAVNLLRWPVLAVMLILILGALYKYAPNRTPAKWQWVSVGSIVATALWLAGSLLFSIYIDNFGKVGKTYGSFSAVVTLMLWLFLTTYIILVGAEINAESEHQTAEDSTEDPEKPMGQRGAYHADHVAGPGGDEEDDG